MTNNFLGSSNQGQNQSYAVPSLANRGISPRRPRDNMAIRSHGKVRENSIQGTSGASFFQNSASSTMNSGLSISSGISGGSNSSSPPPHKTTHGNGASDNDGPSNVTFVDVQTLLFGDNPVPLNPRTF
jgi:hypothetical protein